MIGPVVFSTKLLYDPSKNQNNVFIKEGRRITELPEPSQTFKIANPLAKLLQPDSGVEWRSDKFTIC